MNNFNLTWAIVFTIMAVAGLVGMFWNPAHWLTLAGCTFLAWAFWHDYVAERKRK